MPFQHEPVKARAIEDMHRCPSIGSITDVGRHTFLASDPNKRAHEPLLHCVVNLRETHNRHVHTPVRGSSSRVLRRLPRVMCIGIVEVLRRDSTWCCRTHTHHRGDDQGPIRILKLGTQSVKALLQRLVPTLSGLSCATISLCGHGDLSQRKGPSTFDCDHGDLLCIYRDAPTQPLKALYFDNEGHVIHQDVSAPRRRRWYSCQTVRSPVRSSAWRMN